MDIKILINGDAYDYWNSFAAKGSSYTEKYASHFVSRDQIFNDLKNGTLSQVSWLIPRDNASEHTPTILCMEWIV